MTDFSDERGAVSFIEASYLMPLIAAVIIVLLLFQLALLSWAMDEAALYSTAMVQRSETDIETEETVRLEASMIERWLEQSVTARKRLKWQPVRFGYLSTGGAERSTEIRLDNGYDDINLWRIEALRRLRRN